MSRKIAKAMTLKQKDYWLCSKKKPTERLRRQINSWRGISNAKPRSDSQMQ